VTVTSTSYPPEHHFVRDLDVTSWQVSADRSVCAAPVVGWTRARSGEAALGFLAALVDVNAAMVALIAAHPDWAATADLTLHATGPLTTGPAVVDSRLVRAGSNIVVVGADVYDAAGLDVDVALTTPVLAPETVVYTTTSGARMQGSMRRAATGLLTFARIPRKASVSNGIDPASVIGVRRRLSPPPGPAAGSLGLRVVDGPAGVVELDATPYVSNSFGTINGGVLGMVFQAAAEAALPGLVATDLHIHYLAQAKAGPARTAASVLRRSGDHAVCAVEAVDAGNGDRLLALASLGLQRI
jgi:acyl-coenzyme A thioesterase PaaI-like protein